MSTLPESQITVRRIVQLEAKPGKPEDLITVDGRKFLRLDSLRREPFKSKYGGRHLIDQDAGISRKLVNREPEILEIRWRRARACNGEIKRGRTYVELDYLDELAKARQKITCDPKDFERHDSLKCTFEQAIAMGFRKQFLRMYSDYHTPHRESPSRPHPTLNRAIKCGLWFDGLNYRPWFWKKDLRKILDTERPGPNLWVATCDLPKYGAALAECFRASQRKVPRLDGELMKSERFPTAPEKHKTTMLTYWWRSHVIKLGQPLETSETYEFKNSADGETYIPFSRFLRMTGLSGDSRRWFNRPNPSWDGLTLRAIPDLRVKLKHKQKTHHSLVCLSDALAIAQFLKTGAIARRPVADERAAELMARVRDMHANQLPAVLRRARQSTREARAARENTAPGGPLARGIEAAVGAAEKAGAKKSPGPKPRYDAAADDNLFADYKQSGMDMKTFAEARGLAFEQWKRTYNRVKDRQRGV